MDVLTYLIKSKQKGKNMNLSNEDIKNKFIGADDDEVFGRFSDHMGEDCDWFPLFLQSLKKDWINKGFKISDILIREDKPILVAQIKNYVPFSSESFKRNFTPTRTSITAIVKKLTFVDVEKKSGKNIDDIHEFSLVVEGLGVFRISYSSDESGVGMSIRYLSFNLPMLNEMDYPKMYDDFIKNLIMESTVNTPSGKLTTKGLRTGGLILHVGSTGHGKSTSIAAEVGYLADNITGSIVTYENPIEYRYVGTTAPVRQFEIGVDIKSDNDHKEYENVKRHILRNNPSVVVYGEARSSEEIREVIDAAARGHLVFTTIHASSAMEALTTLRTVTKDEPRLLQSVLRSIMAHRLVVNREGRFVPLYETFIPDQQALENLGAGTDEEYKKIAKRYVIEGGSNNSLGQTFQRALTIAAKEEKLTTSEVSEIKGEGNATSK